MKFFFIAAATLLFSSQTFAQVSDYEKIACDRLMVSAEQTCFEVLMEQCKADGYSDQECEDAQDGDWAVAQQECAWGEMENLMVEFNKSNPDRPAITCEDN